MDWSKLVRPVMMELEHHRMVSLVAILIAKEQYLVGLAQAETLAKHLLACKIQPALVEMDSKSQPKYVMTGTWLIMMDARAIAIA